MKVFEIISYWCIDLLKQRQLPKQWVILPKLRLFLQSQTPNCWKYVCIYMLLWHHFEIKSPLYIQSVKNTILNIQSANNPNFPGQTVNNKISQYKQPIIQFARHMLWIIQFALYNYEICLELHKHQNKHICFVVTLT